MRLLALSTALSLTLAAIPARSFALSQTPSVEEALDYLRTHRAPETADSILIRRVRRVLFTIGGALLLTPLTRLHVHHQFGRPIDVQSENLERIVNLTRSLAVLGRFGLVLTSAVTLAQTAPQGLTVLTHWDDFEQRREFEKFLDEDRDQQIARLHSDPELGSAIVAIATGLAHHRARPRADLSPIFENR